MKQNKYKEFIERRLKNLNKETTLICHSCLHIYMPVAEDGSFNLASYSVISKSGLFGTCYECGQKSVELAPTEPANHQWHLWSREKKRNDKRTWKERTRSGTRKSMKRNPPCTK